MKIETRATLLSLVCLLIVISMVMLYRVSEQNLRITSEGMELVENNQIELRNLRRSIVGFEQTRQKLDSDVRLSKQYFEKPITHYAEFEREGVEKIEKVLKSTYFSDGRFELKKFSISHRPGAPKNEAPNMLLVIEGNKRLEKR